MTTNCADLTTGLSNLPDSYFVDEYYQENAYTARLMLEITKTLYLGGEERFPLVEESMKDAMPDDFFKRDWNVAHDWVIAQTSAAYWGDGAGDRIHCTGIIYTPSPILLTVMMKNIADMDIMGGVAWRFSHLGAALGERLHPDGDSSDADLSTNSVSSEVQAAEAIIPQVADASSTDSSLNVAPEPVVSPANTVTPPAEPAPTVMPETPVPSSAMEIPVPSILPTESTATLQDTVPSPSSKSPFRFFLIGFLVLFVAVVAVAIVLIVRERPHRKRRRRRSHR